METNPDAQLRVYAVWAETVSRNRRTWSPDLMQDPRVMHLWDEEAVVGRWFPKQEELRQLTGPTPLAGSFYFVYGPEARWDRIPSPVVGAGHPIIDRRKDLRRDILPLLSQR